MLHFFVSLPCFPALPHFNTSHSCHAPLLQTFTSPSVPYPFASRTLSYLHHTHTSHSCFIILPHTLASHPYIFASHIYLTSLLYNLTLHPRFTTLPHTLVSLTYLTSLLHNFNLPPYFTSLPHIFASQLYLTFLHHTLASLTYPILLPRGLSYHLRLTPLFHTLASDSCLTHLSTGERTTPPPSPTTSYFFDA